VPEMLIEAEGLTKRFGDFTAVAGIDISVHRSEAFKFLGPNGAGKSSTMRMIGCTSPRTSSSLRILDLDPETDGPAIRAGLGVVPQEDTLNTELTVIDNLIVYGATSTCRARWPGGAPATCSSSRSSPTGPSPRCRRSRDG